ncbi:hypothetical protein FB446DRAFT_801895 [Lentinula raphanica]|nr:hypothetical protein FB446DRAFT_801895 [Lentinula raphanica]
MCPEGSLVAFRYKGQDRTHGTTGKNMMIIRVKCACVNYHGEHLNCDWQGKKFVLKIGLSAGENRVSEYNFLDHCRKIAVGEHEGVLNHLPEIHCSFDILFRHHWLWKYLCPNLASQYQSGKHDWLWTSLRTSNWQSPVHGSWLMSNNPVLGRARIDTVTIWRRHILYNPGPIRCTIITQSEWEPSVAPSFSEFTIWLNALRRGLAQFADHQGSKEAKNAGRGFVKSQEFDRETLSGYVAYEVFVWTMHSFEDEELETYGREWQSILLDRRLQDTPSR